MDHVDVDLHDADWANLGVIPSQQNTTNNLAERIAQPIKQQFTSIVC